MANYGIGIGSFMAGLQQGKAAAAAANQQDFQNNLATNADQRAGAAATDALATSKQSRDQSATTFGNQQQDYADNKPLVAAQREDKLATLKGAADTIAVNTAAAADSDAAYSAAQGQSIFPVGKDANGDPTFSVDGKLVGSAEAASDAFDRAHQSRMQTYYNTAGPKIINDFIENGQPEKAQAFIKAHQDVDFQKGVDSLGRLEGAYQTGDWSGVNENLNNILSNAGYINSANHDASAKPIIGPDGTATGLTVSYKNKNTGEDVTKTFNSMADLHAAISGLISPQAAVAHNTALEAGATATATKAAEEAIKTKGQIAVGAALGDQNRLTEAAKAGLPMTQATHQKLVDDIMLKGEDAGYFPDTKNADGTTRPLTPVERLAIADKIVDITHGPVNSGAPASAPGAPILAGRPPAPAVTSGQSIMFRQPQAVPAPAPATQPQAPAPGSVSNYEAQHNLSNVPSNAPAKWADAIPPQYAPKQEAPAPGDDGSDAFARRLGILDVTAPQATAGAPNYAPQGRSIEDYIKSLKPSVAAQIAQDANKRRLTVGR